MIRFDNVWKSFEGRPVLKGISFTITPGEMVAILGKSGTGKTVTIKHILGLLRPDRGRVFVEDVDVTRASRRTLNILRRRFGYVFQGAALFDSLTVYENLALPLKERGWPQKKRDEAIRWALEMVGLSGTENLYPAEMSGGMRKRAGIARAIVARPDYLIYDEPTSGLDPVTADRINDLMLYLKDQLDVTGVMVTHDLVSALKVADRLILLEDGEIAVDIPVKRAFDETHPAFRAFLRAAGLLEHRGGGEEGMFRAQEI